MSTKGLLLCSYSLLCKVNVKIVNNVLKKHTNSSRVGFPSSNKEILCKRLIVNKQLNSCDMSQKSITSFFIKTPKKTATEISSNGKSPSNEKESSIKLEHTESDDAESKKSPPKGNATKKTKGNQKEKQKSVKRQRLDSSDGEPSSPDQASRPTTPPPANKKRNSKRQRIESSGSEPEIPAAPSTPPPEPVKPATPKSTKPIKTESKPKISKKDTKVKPDKSPLVERNGKAKSPNVKIKKEDINESPESKQKSVNGDTKENEEGGKVAESEYSPQKSRYHPIKDACWSRGEPVPYLALARTLEAIEATSARLKIVETLSNYFRSVSVLSPEDLLPSVYMCLNRLAPAYESLELGVAETYLMKAIGQATGRTLAQVKAAAGKTGDLGLVAEQARAKQRTMFQPQPLTVRAVFAALKDVAHMTGQASVNKKIGKITSVFVACRQSEARYFIRSLAGKLRIGLAEQSVLQALGQAAATTPPAQAWPPEVLDASRGVPADVFKATIDQNALVIKTTYCECPNYEMLVPVLLREGVSALPRHCRLTPGIPLKPMLAHPTRGVHEVFQRFENQEFTCEWKYDGERAQIHVPSDAEGKADLARASIFSRNQENNTTKYPDVLARLPSALDPSVVSCVLDCEAVAWDREKKQILPFQILSTRKRKDASVEDIKVQVCVFMFDLLFLNGRPLVAEPLSERRRLLNQHFKEVEGEWLLATSRDCTTMEQVQEFLEESVKGSCEGLMVKTLAGKDATYEIAKRSRNWLKLKKDYLEGVGDTLDVVVMGGYRGRGKRAGVYGGFLLACYDGDAEQYQSLCKIGTGFTEDDLQTLSTALQQHEIEQPRNYYRFDNSHTPDVWFEPWAVWEVRCADLSLSPAHHAAIGLVDPDKGISLRFPRFVRVREDKKPEEATSARQVADIYLGQDQVKNQGPQHHEDDFY